MSETYKIKYAKIILKEWIENTTEGGCIKYDFIYARPNRKSGVYLNYPFYIDGGFNSISNVWDENFEVLHSYDENVCNKLINDDLSHSPEFYPIVIDEEKGTIKMKADYCRAKCIPTTEQIEEEYKGKGEVVCVFDLVVQHKGFISYGFIITDGRKTTDNKIILKKIEKELKKIPFDIEVYTIDANWILLQKEKPSSLKADQLYSYKNN